MQGRTNAKQSQISSAETKLSLLALTQGRDATFGLVYPAVTSVLQPVKKEGKKQSYWCFLCENASVW